MFIVLSVTFALGQCSGPGERAAHVQFHLEEINKRLLCLGADRFYSNGTDLHDTAYSIVGLPAIFAHQWSSLCSSNTLMA